MGCTEQRGPRSGHQCIRYRKPKGYAISKVHSGSVSAHPVSAAFFHYHLHTELLLYGYSDLDSKHTTEDLDGGWCMQRKSSESCLPARVAMTMRRRHLRV